MMYKLRAMSAHKYFVPGLSFIIAFLIIFFAGPYFSFAGYTPLQSVMARLIFFFLLLGIYILVVYIKHLKQQSKQDKMVDELSAEEDSTKQAIDAESKELKAKFKHAFDTLKKTKGGITSLADIPWYMIIGSPGSGKTTLLSNSGLRFPLGKEFDNKALKGIGGTKNCDWWITQDAVLLDTAGRYASQDSFQQVDESGWQNFLEMIKKYRKKPISGILVSISMSDLTTLNEYELSQLTTQLKRRVAEVNSYFSTKFPIYLIITKTDMLSGFTQFYETLSHKEREQVLGHTFSKEASLNGTVDEEFNYALDELLAAQSRRQWTRMSLERDTNRKSLIFSFVSQLATLKPALINALSILGRNDDGFEPGILRGIYFTSGTQSGAPIDRMIEMMSKAYGLKNSARVSWNNDQRSYFINELLKDVVFAEADQFGNLSSYEKKMKLIKKSLMGTCVVATLALCIGLVVSYFNNTAFIDKSSLAVQQWVDDFDNKTANQDIRRYIPALNEFADNIQGLQDSANESFSGLGLDQSDSINNSLNASYKRLLSTVLMPYIKQQLESQIRKPKDISQLYQALKTYLMIANIDKRDNEFVARYLLENLNQDQYFSDIEYSQIQVHVQNLVDNDTLLTEQNKDIIERARRTLTAQPLGEIYYKQFKQKYLSDPSKYLSMAQLAGSDWRLLLSTELDDIQTISSLYTPTVFKTVVEEEIDTYIDDLGSEAWVLGPENVINQTGLRGELEKLYARDYVNSWQSLLNSTSVKSSTDIASLRVAIQRLIEVDSPFFALLTTVSNATKLVEPDKPMPSLNLGTNTNRAIDAVRQTLNENDPKFYITSRFSYLHEAMATDKKLSTEQQLSALLQTINVAISFQMQNSQSEMDPQLVNNLQGFGFLQVAPLNSWLAQLTQNIQGSQNKATKQQLTAIWRQQIVRQCKDIVDFKYPFVPTANTDASVNDLERLFGLNGILNTFFTQNIESMVNTRTRPWTWNSGVQASFGFSGQVLPFFERVTTIQRSLYATDSGRASLPLSLTPEFLSPNLQRFRMQVYGESLSYQFGRPNATAISWPPSNANSRSEYSFVRRDNSEITDGKSGLYALFKLIDDASVERIDSNSARITFEKGNNKATYLIESPSPIDPLVFSSLKSFKCIDSL